MTAMPTSAALGLVESPAWRTNAKRRAVATRTGGRVAAPSRGRTRPAPVGSPPDAATATSTHVRTATATARAERQERQGIEPAAGGLDVAHEAPGEEAGGGVREADGQRRPDDHRDRGVDQLIGDDLAAGHADRAERATLDLREA